MKWLKWLKIQFKHYYTKMAENAFFLQLTNLNFDCSLDIAWTFPINLKIFRFKAERPRLMLASDYNVTFCYDGWDVRC